MKVKVLLLLVTIVAGTYAAYSCSYAECGGGSVVCCTIEQSGEIITTYYAKGE